MRICFVGHQATKEGAGRFMLDQIDYLLKQGIVLFAIFPAPGPLCDELAARGVEVSVVPNKWWIKPSGVQSRRDYESAMEAARTIAGLFRTWAIDVAYTETIVVAAGALGAALAGIPHVWHLHEFSYNPGVIDMVLPRAAMARLMDLTSNFVFFNSKAVAGEWRGFFPEAKTRVVYNWTSLPVDDLPPDTMDLVAVSLLESPTTFVATIVGSIIPFKRQMDAIRALENLRREGLDVALLVVGPALHPSYSESLIKLVHDQRLEDRVRFIGYTDHPQRIMRRANVTLVCSDSESFGRVTIESMNQGTPVIGAASGGTAEIIDDRVDGLLFPAGDVDALTDRLRSLVQDEPLRRRLAEGAIAKGKRFFGAEPVMAPVVELLRALVGKNNPSWPLGTVIRSGGAFGASAIIRGISFRNRVRQVMRRVW